MNVKESASHVLPGCLPPEPPLETVHRASGRRGTLSLQQYVDGILHGDRTILARAITLV